VGKINSLVLKYVVLFFDQISASSSYQNVRLKSAMT